MKFFGLIFVCCVNWFEFEFECEFIATKSRKSFAKFGTNVRRYFGVEKAIRPHPNTYTTHLFTTLDKASKKFHLSSLQKHTQRDRQTDRGDISIVYGIHSYSQFVYIFNGVYRQHLYCRRVCAMCMEFVPNTLQKRLKNNNANRTYFERHTMVSHTTATATAASAATAKVTSTPPTISVFT